MAHGYFNSLCKNGDFEAISAGIFADGTPISANAKAVLNENSIDFTHMSVQVTKGLVQSAEYVFGISHSHASRLISMFPEYADKIYTLPNDISDPFGGSIDVYRSCFEQIKNNVDSVYKYITGENDKQ